MDLVRALEAERGLVCVVGAGGKKSTLYALADAHERAVVTATVRIPIFDARVAEVVVTGGEDPASALRRVEEWPVGLVPERDRHDRYAGYDPDIVSAIAEANAADVVLVKADGARTREFKAPGDHEPRLPTDADVVLPIASARVVGEPLAEERVHRPERVASLTGLEAGDPVAPGDVATVLTSDRGGLKDVPADATVVPVINKVDDRSLERTGREIAREILARADVSRVALTRMTAEEPLVGVVE